MPGQLRSLVREICAGVEIYFTGRQGGEYLKAAFILCDDYTELMNKVYLTGHNPRWSGNRNTSAKRYEEAQKRILDAAKAKGDLNPDDVALVEKGVEGDGFKTYDEVMEEVKEVFKQKRSKDDLPKLLALQKDMKARRRRRNEFFHSAGLLELNVNKQDCPEAFCDLLDYGILLFGKEWTQELEAVGNLPTLEVLLRIEKRDSNIPGLMFQAHKIIGEWPCSGKARARGTHVAEYPHDIHLRLCVVNGGPELRDKLTILLRTDGKSALNSRDTRKR